MPEKTQSMRANIRPRSEPTAPEGGGWGGLTIGPDPDITYYEGGGFAATQRIVANGQDVFIWQLDVPTGPIIQTIRIRMRASIRNTVTRTLQMRANISFFVFQTMRMRARILPRFSKTIRMRARIFGRQAKTIRLRGDIRNTVTRTTTMRARIRRIQFDIMMRARITKSVTQTIDMRAQITPNIQQRIDMRANIRNTITQSMQSRARILPVTDLLMRALIQQIITATVEINWNTSVSLRSPLLLSWNAGDLTRTGQIQQMRAKIASPRIATVDLSWDLEYSLPTSVATFPTERIKVP